MSAPMSNSTIFSFYQDAAAMPELIARRGHRDIVGGLWEELGELQHRFLRQQGLLPRHRLIDIGCGSFRAGVKLVPYLEPGNYYGIDISDDLIRIGFEREIEPLGLAPRLPRGNVAAVGDFDLSAFGVSFDFGLAQSVFTHMPPLACLPRCLAAIAPAFPTGGVFFATLFEAPATETHRPLKHRSGIVTYPDRNPFHAAVDDVAAAVAPQPEWRLDVIGDWNHPRGQIMLRFERR